MGECATRGGSGTEISDSKQLSDDYGRRFDYGHSWYRSYGMTPLLSTGLEGGETPAQGLTSSDAEEDDEGVDEVRHWMLDNWFHLGKTCRKNSEDYQ